MLFQISLPLNALPRGVIIASRFMVTASSGHAALAYHQAASLLTWLEFNCLQLAAMSKAAELSIYWLDAAYRLGIPLQQGTFITQLYEYYHQSGEWQASLKVA